jgi:hypothetical protein
VQRSDHGGGAPGGRAPGHVRTGPCRPAQRPADRHARASPAGGCCRAGASEMTEWIPIAWHSQGYVLSRQATRWDWKWGRPDSDPRWGTKRWRKRRTPVPRWTRLQLTHPNWEHGVPLTWMAERHRLSGDPRFIRENEDICTWVTESVGPTLCEAYRA